MENSSNMLLMILGILQHTKKQNGASDYDTSFFYPKYWKMLSLWADILIQTEPFPANQICTDDFTGPLANNTNLGAKGIVALQAFGELCKIVEPTNPECEKYFIQSESFVATWKSYGVEASPLKHYKIAFDVPNSYSLKYNLVWTQLLDLKQGNLWNDVITDEIAYYKTKSNKFGVPMDMRHAYVKSDWLCWAATMSSNQEDFHFLFDPMFDMLNSTSSREPFTDLYDTNNALITFSEGFIARPVIGGLFSQALKYQHVMKLSSMMHQGNFEEVAQE